MPLSTKRQLIDVHHPELSIKDQCDALGMARSTFYYEEAQETEFNMLLMRKIDEIHLRRPFYGYRRMTAELINMGYRANRKRVRRLMEKMGVLTLYPKRKLSTPIKDIKKYPYLLRGVTISRINQVWSTDITYIPLAKGFLYLVAVMDWFSRYVLSWELSNTLDEEFCLEALESALKMGKPEIFNSDQGSQFTGNRFTNRLELAKISISWDGKGRALDNVFIERLWRSLKYEKVYPECFENALEAYKGLREYFIFYNEKRPHQSLNYSTPLRVYCEGGVKNDC